VSLFVLDAKYKNLDEKQIDRNDIHQIISYMYVQKAELGGFVNPIKDNPNTNPIAIGQLRGYGGNVKLWELYIPQYETNFSDFQNKMKKSEDGMANTFQTI
jgi:5-methylcytosine-specific restriction endonuclease McrBC regulatory subunit McrC